MRTRRCDRGWVRAMVDAMGVNVGLDSHDDEEVASPNCGDSGEPKAARRHAPNGDL